MINNNRVKFESFSEYFNVSQEKVKKYGFFDIVLAIDSPLYIDAKLLKDDIPFFPNVSTKIRRGFSTLVGLVKKVKQLNKKDPFWYAADRFLTFHEIKGTCLGYSNKTINGHAIGPTIRHEIIERTHIITSAGTLDTEIIDLLCIFTNRFGCDLSSDLITHLLADSIYDYNEFLIKELGLDDKEKISYNSRWLLKNPYFDKTPILLVPKCILSDLPLCFTYYDIEDVVNENENARMELQKYVDLEGKLSKDSIYNSFANDSQILKFVINHYRVEDARPYDYEKDPRGLILNKELMRILVENNPSIILFKKKEHVDDVLNECLRVFKYLIENCGRNKLQKVDEKVLQFIFYSMSYTICNVNDIALISEPNYGLGPMDFEISGGSYKIAIEFKKSQNPKYLSGLTKQLVTYMKSGSAFRGVYVFFNYDGPENVKLQKLSNGLNKVDPNLRSKLEIINIDTYKVESASK